MLISCFGLFACGKNTKSGTKITLDNYDEYLSISARVYGSGTSSWLSYNKEYGYHEATGSVSISGINGYEYINCVINVQINFSYGDSYNSIDISVKINRGGTGAQSESVYLDQYWASSWITKYASYHVTSVSGSIIKAS